MSKKFRYRSTTNIYVFCNKSELSAQELLLNSVFVNVIRSKIVKYQFKNTCKTLQCFLSWSGLNCPTWPSFLKVFIFNAFLFQCISISTMFLGFSLWIFLFSTHYYLTYWFKKWFPLSLKVQQEHLSNLNFWNQHILRRYKLVNFQIISHSVVTLTLTTCC